MSSAGLGSTTTLLGGSPSGQAAGHVNNQTQFTLVLGGGGMKGVAHVGVLQALTERGLVPSQIVGSSVGALVGAAWSAGKSIAELHEIAVGLVRKDIFAVAHADMAFKRMRSPALFRREPLDTLLQRLVGDLTFQDLRNRLIVNTVDLNSGMQVFWGLDGLDEVPVKDAVFASCALPGYLPPREIRGRFYMDGATVDNLPVGTARILGSDVIVAVDVSASNALRADTQDEGFASVFARAAEIAMQTILELRLREWTTPPIYYIHPRVEHISAFDFDHLREVVEEGYRATVAALDQPEEWPGSSDTGVHPRRPVSVRVQRERCIGCGACLVQAPPGMFVLDAEGKAVVTRPDQEWSPIDGEFIRHCPTYAISARPAAEPKAAGSARQLQVLRRLLRRHVWPSQQVLAALAGLLLLLVLWRVSAARGARETVVHSDFGAFWLQGYYFLTGRPLFDLPPNVCGLAHPPLAGMVFQLFAFLPLPVSAAIVYFVYLLL